MNISTSQTIPEHRDQLKTATASNNPSTALSLVPHHYPTFILKKIKKMQPPTHLRTALGGPNTPRLTVVGAGIGDPELITLKAIRAIGEASVILYDALVNEALLDYARHGTLVVYVGKRRSYKAYTQEAINQLIVEYAHERGHVVRLKGGDPFVFGRGHEEMDYAQAHGVEVAYVPGVSSAIAGVGAAGIAVTRRGASRSFWTLTATTDTGDLNPELAVAARTDATVVVLMGLTKLPEIARIWAEMGKNDLPLAIIQNASLPDQRVFAGRVAEVEQLLAHAHPTYPTLIVLGETVRHRFSKIPETIDLLSVPNDLIQL
jgi:uroporphyrin-III C-methyltransferase